MVFLVFLDLDSTACKIEGLDWLAELKGVGKRVKEMTKSSMNGNLSFKEAIKRKIELIRPSRKDFELLAKKYLESLTDGVEEFVEKVKRAGGEVFLITGNFALPAVRIAKRLKIPEENVYSNRLIFDESGHFKAVDLKNPLIEDRGKLVVVRSILKNYPGAKSAFIGDGATDLVAKEAVDVFIGFGGVVEREKVKKEADFFAYSFKEVEEILEGFLI